MTGPVPEWNPEVPPSRGKTPSWYPDRTGIAAMFAPGRPLNTTQELLRRLLGSENLPIVTGKDIDPQTGGPRSDWPDFIYGTTEIPFNSPNTPGYAQRQYARTGIRPGQPTEDLLQVYEHEVGHAARNKFPDLKQATDTLPTVQLGRFDRRNDRIPHKQAEMGIDRAEELGAESFSNAADIAQDPKRWTIDELVGAEDSLPGSLQTLQWMGKRIPLDQHLKAILLRTLHDYKSPPPDAQHGVSR